MEYQYKLTTNEDKCGKIEVMSIIKLGKNGMSVEKLSNNNVQSISTIHIGASTERRHKVSRLASLLQRYILLAKYLGFVITFLMLVAIRVVPDYKGVSRFNPIEWVEMAVFTDYLWFLAITMFLHVFMYVQSNLYNRDTQSTISKELFYEVKLIFVSFMVALGITFLLKTTFLYSRLTLVMFVIAMIVESSIWIWLHRAILKYLYRKGKIKKNVIIVGAGKVGLKLYENIEKLSGGELSFLGYLDDFKTGEKILGKTSDLEKILQRLEIDRVYVTIPSEKDMVESLLRKVYKYDVDIRIIPEMFDHLSSVFAVKNDTDYPCLQIVKTPLRGLNIVLKRFADICGSISLLMVLSPIFLIIAVLIKIESKGGVFFRQQRIGKNGLPFMMLKFRSMRHDAELFKATLLNQNEMSGPVFKLRSDPRVTNIGRFIRKYSIDELPQLWNVLKGQMSLIGPRPPLSEEVEKYSDYHWRRMDVLPGMTGLWQVSGRSNLTFEQWIDLDIYYIENWSFTLEMKILLKTVPVVIKGVGAY